MGLWHGASWNFVILGGIHGAGPGDSPGLDGWNPLARLKGPADYQVMWTLFSHLLTLAVVLVSIRFLPGRIRFGCARLL